MVQRIEEFCSELQADTLGDGSIFHHRDIDSLKSGPVQHASSDVAPGSDGWKRERRWIEPLFLSLQQHGAGK